MVQSELWMTAKLVAGSQKSGDWVEGKGGWFGLHVGDLLEAETCGWVGLFFAV